MTTVIVLAIAACFAVLSPAAVADEVVQSAAGVPGQERAWELVSPAAPTSARLAGVYAISPDGSRVAYEAFGPLPDSTFETTAFTSATALRGPDGWTNRMDQVPPNVRGVETVALQFSADLSASVWKTRILDETGEAPYVVFLRTPAGFTVYRGFETPEFAGLSPTSEHVILRTVRHVLPGDAARVEGQSLYEAVGSTIHLVDVDNTGALLSNCGSSPGKALFWVDDAGDNWISNDGRRVFFTTHPGCAGPLRTFMRVDGATTTEIGLSQCDLADCGEAADVRFAAATSDGSSAYLLTAEKLLNADADSLPDLYRYDVGDGRLTLISSDRQGENLITQGGVRYLTDDGSRVYFNAVEAGVERVFMADASGPHPIPDLPAGTSVEFSADGRYLLAATAAPLSSDDRDERVDAYRYDIERGEVALLSAGQTGGNGAFDVSLAGVGNSLRVTPDRYRSMSADGSRVFFTTAESLLPADRNEAADVYEWVGGALSLISAGNSDLDSFYVNATPDGTTVLFETAGRLLSVDRDGGNWDIYAARIGGGFSEAPPPADCSEPCLAPPPQRRAPPGRELARGKIGLAPIDAAARREFAAKGRIVLLAEVPRAGRLSAQASARIGGRGQTIAGAAVAAEPGPVRLRMRLSDRARRRLASGGDLDVQLRLRFSGLASVQRAFELEGKR